MKMFHVKHRSPHILLINPWITDFAAYNFWIKPHGLLSIASFLRNNGFKITFIDCLDSTVKRKKYGDGKFRKIEIEKPLPVKSVPRKYSQYGISEEIFKDKISYIEKPDLIGITSGMTYWYPGVFKAIRIVKESLKKVPILLGGIYATLCYDHAVKYSEADYVIRGRGELQLSKIISELFNIELTPDFEPRTDIYPAFDLYSNISGGYKRRDPLKVVEEIACWTSRYRVNNIAFYDDALLFNPLEHIIKILKEVRKRDIQCNFHSPNGLHVKEINKKLATLLYDCQFKTLRLGLETSNEAIQVETGGKVDNRSFGEAVGNLRRAGYSEDEIGVYVMAGLPGQRVGEVEESIAFVKENGAKPILVEYSPIPETALFEKAKKMSGFDLENEPLFHNNSIFPCQWEGFTLANLQRLKEKVKT
jgi:radical SAM superfamily enzyme YgiQ (UPF0313 family)